MAVHDDLGMRMKSNYEQITKFRLTRRTPVIIRLDGKAFHSFTRHFKRPFDLLLMDVMHNTMRYLCENIQGCVFGYTQSDEISLLLVDYKRLSSSAWFDNEVQKICSISASMATLAFNKTFDDFVTAVDPWISFYEPKDDPDTKITRRLAKLYGLDPENMDNLREQIRIYRAAQEKGAMFDARCFNIPKEEVTNYFYWRQLDATRNSIEMAGQAQFSHKELQNKSCNMIQDMLHEQRNINWNDYPTDCKRGACCYKVYKLVNDKERSEWIVDHEIPIFNHDRDYIDVWLEPEEC